jgi:hypothetical protein
MRALGFLLATALICSSCDGPAAAVEPSFVAVASETAALAAPPAIEAPVALEAADAPASTDSAVLDSLPWEQRIGLEQAMAAADPRFAPRMDETGPVLETPGSTVASIAVGGARLDFGAHEASLRVAGVGRGESVREIAATGTVEIAGAEVRTSRGDGISEWWRSLPSGLEHGVTIETRPVGEGELRVELAVGGSLRARSVSDDAVELVDVSGNRVAMYAQLVVLDADGARVAARMGVHAGRVVLGVSDEGARYPLVIDPLVIAHEATLLAPDGAAGDRFGCSVALSSDGSRALVGARLDDTAGGSDAGSARVFRRAASTWVQEATLVAPDGEGADWFGSSVALTSDGSRALVGVPGDTAAGAGTGSARVFFRTGTTWAQEAMLLAPDFAYGDSFGNSVALTSDGSRAIVGAVRDDTAGGPNAGSARVFLRTGTTWAHEATLLASDGSMFDEFGTSVALTSDGSRALVGARLDNTPGGIDAGSARVFVRSGTMWGQEATLLAPDGALNDWFGASVSLTSDGSRALVGAYVDDTPGGGDGGSAHVFFRTGSTWAQEATLLAPDGASDDFFGISVALTGDGSRALIGALGDDTAGGNTGSARLFLRTGSTWAQEGTLVAVAPDGQPSDAFGTSVALTLDGSRAIVGADQSASGRGDARAFTIVLGTSGSSCSGDAVCASGFCTDGVCCNARCAGGPMDCQACSGALTGGASGTCAPLSGTVAPTVTCRASAGVCDVPETCESASAACPADLFASGTTVCSTSVGPCDVPQTCTGISPACPANGPAPAGTVCRSVAGLCDMAEVCDGTTTACPADASRPAGTTCRPSAGGCDAAEVCDGRAVSCPGDVVLPRDTLCGGTGPGTCSSPGMCDGSGAACPGAAIFPNGTVCLPAAAGNPCDLDDLCDGTTDVCRPTFAPVTTACGSTAAGDCDAPDHCAGTSADCEAVFLEGTECRAAAGPCDSPERCGSSPDCPADDLVSAGLSCRVSTDTSCDPAETCDGASVTCPADVTTCAPRPDGGPRVDAAVPGSDAGPPPPAPVTGCACSAAVPNRPLGGFTLLALFALVTFALRRRR